MTETQDYADTPNSWLVMVQVTPIPEPSETEATINRIIRMVDKSLPRYKVNVSAVYASNIEVIGMDDLDALETLDDF